MAPRIVDKEERKRQIALVALEQFASRGFEATSISQVAAAAKIGKGTIYEYFESKADLTVAAVEAWVTTVSAEVEGGLESTDPPEQRLEQLCLASMDAFINDERSVKLFIAIIQLYLSDEHALSRFNFVHKLFAGMRTAIIDILLEGVACGAFRPDTAEHAEAIAINLCAYLDGIGMHFLMNRDFIDIEKQITFYIRDLLRSLRVQDNS